MTRLIRMTGFLLILSGAICILTWLIEPLREIWPWLRRLPLPVQIGFALAALGLVLLVSTLLWERWEERGQDRALREEE